MNCKKLLTPLLFLSALVCAYPQSLDKAKLDQLLNQLSEKNKAMGTLLIKKEGQVLYNRSIGYGYIDGAEMKPLSLSTKYRIGSITKMFTAVMVYQLIEKGKLKLADHLAQFYPQLPNASSITIEHLLAHRSGLAGSLAQQFARQRYTGVSKDSMLAAIARSQPEFEPGERYAYSNAGYFILATIIEKVSGQPYEKALQQMILSRIGLKDTYAATEDIAVNKNESYSFRYYTGWQQEPVTHHSFLFGAGSVISTVSDVAAFIEALFDGKLITKQHLDLMIRLQSGMDGFTFHGKTFYGHSGGVDGFGAWIAYQPEEKLAISYATNGKVYPVANIINYIVDICYNKPVDIPSFESLELSAEILDKYTGVYVPDEGNVKFTVTREGNKLLIQMTGRPAFAVDAIAENVFKFESSPLEFHFDAAKGEMTIKRPDGQRVLVKEK